MQADAIPSGRPARQARAAVRACELCARECRLTFHHLIPKRLHGRPRFRRAYSREALASGIMVCELCHRGLHRLYDERHLAQHLHSRELLLADPVINRHVRWVARQKRG